MPELPEVETIVRGLRRPLAGRRVESVRVLRPDLLDTPSGTFRTRIRGATFQGVRRRGKNLVLELEAGSSRFSLVVNLGMSGRLLIREAGEASPPPTHPGVRFRLDGAGELVYNDPRRFGRLVVLDPRALRAWSHALGPEPLGAAFTASRLARGLATSSSPIRSWLLDQTRVAGVGNIYANEALFLARVHPAAPARSIPSEAVAHLREAIRSVLRSAIRARGTTLRDYRTAQGREGGYAVELRVYGREAEPCPRCRAAVRRIVFGGRSAFFCPECQREAQS